MLEIRERRPDDEAAVAAFLDDRNALRSARKGELVDALAHPALVAEEDGRPAGVLHTYIVTGTACEVHTLHAATRGRGVGSALIDAVVELARARGCDRLWLITTNDNVDAVWLLPSGGGSCSPPCGAARSNAPGRR